MSQGYKLRFDQMKENNPAQPESEPQDDETDFYQNDGSIRELCLVFKNGNMDAFPYSFITYKKFRINEMKNSIIIELPSKIITLSGYGLMSLMLALKKQLPNFIYQIDERYAKQEESVVTDITVEEKS